MARILPLALLAMLLLTTGASAQTKTLDHWTPAQLLDRAKHLREAAAHGDGSASEVLERYPRHYTMLAFRNRSGLGEEHWNYADVFYILPLAATNHQPAISLSPHRQKSKYAPYKEAWHLLMPEP